ncbi:MAG: hypothetical protein AUK47_20395 [Deltaproteobacteria bacterium CG2_30_63_29]|nr:MAG: hypothetical protein AUK47_20395 [Deltaproteobacteria bacterium CG2_30_63_29]PJB34634.1 MAG: hypothetical protein CO108_27820 [Deltaproteobacteria bacterium CG_4_9_14_3_um_filter_63_12]
MREIKLLTVPFEVQAGFFDDEAVRGYLASRVLLRCKAAFFESEGRAYWTLFLETRMAQGAVATGPAGEHVDQGKRAAFDVLLGELDENERHRYERLLAWRRDAAMKEGVPPYVLFGNREALELSRRNPTTLSGLEQVRGMGARRVKRHGKAILETLHGCIPELGGNKSAPARAVVRDDAVAVGTDRAVSEAPAAHTHGADRAGGADDARAAHERELPEGPQQGGAAARGERPDECAQDPVATRLQPARAPE